MRLEYTTEVECELFGLLCVWSDLRTVISLQGGGEWVEPQDPSSRGPQGWILIRKEKINKCHIGSIWEGRVQSGVDEREEIESVVIWRLSASLPNSPSPPFVWDDNCWMVSVKEWTAESTSSEVLRVIWRFILKSNKNSNLAQHAKCYFGLFGNYSYIFRCYPQTIMKQLRFAWIQATCNWKILISSWGIARL